MTLFSALRALPDMEVVGLNFSSATTPELLLKTLDHYCEYRKTPNGVVLTPTQLGKWLIMFCDEINLPDMDKYGTQVSVSSSCKFMLMLLGDCVAQRKHSCFPPSSPGFESRLS